MDENYGVAEETGVAEPIDIPDDVPVEGYAKYWLPGWLYDVLKWVFFFNDTATTEIYTSLFVGSVRCV